MANNSMGPVKNFRVLNISKRSAAVTTMGQMPFFFIAIFLFKNDSVMKIDKAFITDLYFYFLLCFCFCLSVGWSLMNVITAYVLIAITDSAEKEPADPHEKYISTIIYSFVYLSGILILGYEFKFQFETFLLTAYSFIGIMILWRILTLFLFKRNIS